MVELLGPFLFRSKLAIQCGSLLPHEGKNFFIIVRFQPEAVFRATINLQSKKTVFKSFEARGTDRALQLGRPVHDIQ